MCSGVLHEGHRAGPEERRVLLQQVPEKRGVGARVWITAGFHLYFPPSTTPPLCRAAAHSKLGNYTEATCDCERAIGIDPTYSKAYGRMG